MHGAAVEALDLSGKALRELPSVVCRADFVEELCLEDNALVTLPEGDVGRCVPGRRYNASHCSVPPRGAEIGTMAGLKELYVRRNGLTRLPEALARCVRLQSLYLEDNELEGDAASFPPTLSGLAEMGGITLQRNLLACVPEPVLAWSQLTVRTLPSSTAPPLSGAHTLRVGDVRAPRSHSACLRLPTGRWPPGAVP